MQILSFQWIRETVQIEVIIVRPNSHVNISEQFMIRECIRPFEGSVHVDLHEDVDKDDYLRKEVSSGKTKFKIPFHTFAIRPRGGGGVNLHMS